MSETDDIDNLNESESFSDEASHDIEIESETDDIDIVDNLESSSDEANNSEIEQMEETEESFLQGQTVEEYFKNVMSIVKQCQKYSADLQGWQNYADYPAVNKSMSSIVNQLNNLISKIFIHQDIKLNLSGYKLADQFDVIKEGNDALTERINSNIDEACGLNRDNDAEIVDTSVRTIRGPVNQENGREMVLIASRNVQKPQMFFSPKINNSDKEPFIPLLKEKPNSIKPLSIMLCVDSSGREYYSHPYQYELEHWSPPDELLKKNDPVKPLDMSRTPFLLVETEENLNILINELKKEKEIAVDLENHSFRTYQGLTCLIQISSRKKDYIIDPFPIRNQLPLLNEIFTDPKITKVFHGADLDVLWLQRDCGVYVVNMFDTHQGASVLEYPQRSLSYLLKSICSLNADKTYQRADWRMRPLPEDFIFYARQDTHYLLYVYDIIKNELIENGNALNNLLCTTFNRSTELCQKRYEKPIIGPDSHLGIYRRSKKLFNSRQLYALQQLYVWRDKLARQHDESVDYILPRHMMLQMAELLPKEMQGILACCNPIPTYVKMEHLTLHQIIRSARNMPLEEINLESEKHVISDPVHQYHTCNDLMTSVTCRFDLSHMEAETKGLSTLLKPQETLFGDLFNQNSFSDVLKKCSKFWKLENSNKINRMRLKKVVKKEYMSPFERFSTSLEYFKSVEQKEAEIRHKKQKELEARNAKRLESIKEHFMSLSNNKKSKSSKKAKNKVDSQTLETQVDSQISNAQVNSQESEGSSNSSSDSTIATNSTSTSTISDKERMERLQLHIASLTSSIRGTVSKLTNKQTSSVPKLNKRQRRLKNSENNVEKGDTSNLLNPLKRRSADGDTFGKDIKKKKVEEEKEEEKEEGEVSSEEGEEEEKVVEGESENVSFKAFDYSKADLSIFKPKKSKAFKGQRIKQKFKQNNKKSSVFRNNSKSVSWTNNG